MCFGIYIFLHLEKPYSILFTDIMKIKLGNLILPHSRKQSNNRSPELKGFFELIIKVLI